MNRDGYPVAMRLWARLANWCVPPALLDLGQNRDRDGVWVNRDFLVDWASENPGVILVDADDETHVLKLLPTVYLPPGRTYSFSKPWTGRGYVKH